MILHTTLPFLKYPQAIPEELRALPNWVCWKYEKRDGRDTKVPYSPHGGRGKANDAHTWADFEATLAASVRLGMSGIGFQFSYTDCTGIDLDWKSYPGEGIPPEAAAIIEALDSYTEMTPSGKGAHIIVRGKLPPGTRKRIQLSEYVEMEVYSEGRFFTVTGDVIHSPFLEERQGALEALAAQYLGRESTPRAAVPSGPVSGSFSGSDAELWERMFSSRNGDTVRALADGDLSGHGNDHSRADFALCGSLAFWCNGDAARIDAMFRNSGLMRPKWDAKHRGDGTTYGQMTIDEVLSRWDGNGYDPARRQNAQPGQPQADWSAPEVLLRGRQHLASSGSHGASVNSYSTLWQALVHVINAGYYTQDGDELTLTSYGMTEMYAHAGGRPMDRRQQLQFLHSQGMAGPLRKQDPRNPQSAWLLTMPFNPSALPFWATKESLQPLSMNAGRRVRKVESSSTPLVSNYIERETPNLRQNRVFFPFWTVFSLAVLGVGTTAEVADLAGVSERQARLHLDSLFTLCRKDGWKWHSVLSPAEVGELHLNLTADQVAHRRKRILEDRRDFHDSKFEYLTSRGLHRQAAVHFRYAEAYRRHLGEAA